MKVAADVSPDKLRGGFYTPTKLVRLCLDRAQALLGATEGLSVLEPSAGDGAFIVGLAQHEVGSRVSNCYAIELVASEAQKARLRMEATHLQGRVYCGSALAPEAMGAAKYDLAVGNPPFVRFQFIDSEDRAGLDLLSSTLKEPLKGVSNLWIPVFLRALLQVKSGGVFSFVVPAECFTGSSARVLRRWLGQNASELQVDLLPPASYPGVLQEVVILSGRLTDEPSGDTKVSVVDHASGLSWAHTLDDDAPTWTSLLITPEHVTALECAVSGGHTLPLSRFARFTVSTVTGANGFFSMPGNIRDQFGLAPWTRHLLARISHAPGLVLEAQDIEKNDAEGRSTWLLDSNLSGMDPMSDPRSTAYLEIGQQSGIPQRYKCRIRTPWWRVPVVPPGGLALSKRSHRYPRMIVNHARAVTTDTIYRGVTTDEYSGCDGRIVATFHNSLTLLTAELYGRSFAGGVLELVPSEVGQLLLPKELVSPENLARLDQVVRADGPDSDRLIVATNQLICSTPNSGLDLNHFEALEDARQMLLDRRLGRNRSAPPRLEGE